MAFTRPQSGSKGESTHPSAAVVEALADQRRRTILDVLSRLSPTPREELATHVAAAEADTDLSSVTCDAVQRVELELHHTHLPKLEDAGLVRCPNDAVAATDSVPFEVWEFVSDIDADSLDWNELFRALADDRCRAVVSALGDIDAPTDRERLAARAASRHADVSTRAEDVEDVERHIHHVTLPRLDDGGLLSYDPETGTVGHGGQDDSLYRLLDALVH